MLDLYITKIRKLEPLSDEDWKRMQELASNEIEVLKKPKEAWEV